MSEKAKEKIALYERECAPCLKKLEHYLKGGCRNCPINQQFIDIENRKEVDYKRRWEMLEIRDPIQATTILEILEDE